MIKNKKIYFRMQSSFQSRSIAESHHFAAMNALEGFSKSTRGSVTVEGAAVISICLIVFAAILCFFSLLGGQIKEYCKADERSQSEAALAAVLDYSEDIYTFYEYSDEVMLLPDSIKEYIFAGAIVRKPWTGRDLNYENDEYEEYVYVAENGSVYHTTPSCTHLLLTISEASFSELGNLRNEYGERYTECEKCGAASGDVIYIAAEGDRYHSTKSCSGLKRTYRKVKKSEVSLPACSRCKER